MRVNLKLGGTFHNLCVHKIRGKPLGVYATGRPDLRWVDSNRSAPPCYNTSRRYLWRIANWSAVMVGLLELLQRKQSAKIMCGPL